jgi:hypothetical protein
MTQDHLDGYSFLGFRYQWHFNSINGKPLPSIASGTVYNYIAEKINDH